MLLDGARHNVHCLFESGEDILLDIWYPVLLAYRLHERLTLLVTQHTETGPHVVLYLVVEVTVHEVIDVRAGPEVD